MMNARIFILLPVHNRKEITRSFLACLQSQSMQNYHLIVIDDGSSDGTADMVKQLQPEATLLHGDGNLWWAGALQKGIQWLKGNNISDDKLVLIMNDDTKFETDFLATAETLLANRKRTLLLAQCYSQQTEELIDAGIRVDWAKLSHEQAANVDQINCLSTRGLFLRISDLNEIGGFRPHLLPHYASDYEFTIRAHNKGFKLMSDPALKIWSDQSATGIRRIEPDSFFSTFKALFSIRAISNPFVWSMYVVLACPLKWIPLNLCRVWVIASKLLLRAIRNDISGIFKS